VEQELVRVVSGLVRLAGRDLSAILLVGGFGRGEGGVAREGVRLRPMNDYDIVVILRPWAARCVAGRLQKGAEQAQAQWKLSVKQVDVMVTSGARLAIPVPTVARYEMKHGYRVLWGASPGAIRALPARWLPVHEGTKYYRNRAGGLLVARLLLDGCGQFDTAGRRELAFLEINKALLAVGDGHLIQRRAYHYSYEKRREAAQSDARLHGLEVDVASAYVRAIDERRELDIADLGRRDLDTEWQRAGEALLRGFLAFEAERYARQFSTLAAYATFVEDALLSRRSWLALRSRFWVREDVPRLARQRLSAMELLLERVQRPSAETGSVEWFGGWQARAAAFLREWHPGGVVRRIVGE